MENKCNNLKISLITVCYNSSSTIEDTLKSVLFQTYNNYEYLIIDGKSKDNTLEIIKKYEKKFEGKLKYISEKDSGLYYAMNKGIKMTTGDIIGILNSDDILANRNVFATIAAGFKNNSIDGVYSDLVFLDEKLEKPVRNFVAGKYRKRGSWHFPHPTLYLKKEIYDKVGLFDLKYRIAADFDLMLRLKKNELNFLYIPEYLVLMRSGGVSTDGLKGYWKSFDESIKVMKKNNLSFPYIRNILRTIKTFNQCFSVKFKKKSITNKLIKNS